jgi:hypothetical protein
MNAGRQMISNLVEILRNYCGLWLAARGSLHVAGELNPTYVAGWIELYLHFMM